MYDLPRPVQGLSYLLSKAVRLNVSGLSRVGRCCSQAMMRSARIVPNKWFVHKEPIF